MSKKKNIADELKALGSELAHAFEQARNSAEFKNLEKDIASSIKKVSASLIQSIKAAQESKETDVLKKRVNRVVKIGKEKGKAEAEKAVKVGLKKFNVAFENLSKKLHGKTQGS